MESRQDRVESDMKSLMEKVDERFDKLEVHVLELKTKNPIMDFIREKWQVVTLLVVLLVGQPSMDVLHLLVRVLFPATVQ